MIVFSWQIYQRDLNNDMKRLHTSEDHHYTHYAYDKPLIDTRTASDPATLNDRIPDGTYR